MSEQSSEENREMRATIQKYPESVKKPKNYELSVSSNSILLG